MQITYPIDNLIHYSFFVAFAIEIFHIIFVQSFVGLCRKSIYDTKSLNRWNNMITPRMQFWQFHSTWTKSSKNSNEFDAPRPDQFLGRRKNM